MSETINLVKLKEEEQRSNRFYLLLLLAPFITVPWAIVGLMPLSYYAPLHLRLIAISVPGLVYLLLLFGWLSPHRYVRRHMQQALLLAGLRLISSLLFLGLLQLDCFWYLSNGSLWLFGSILGANQLSRGDCWLMRQLGEGDQLPRPWAKAQPGPVRKPPPAKWLYAAGSLAGREALAKGRFLLEQNQTKDAVLYLTAAFHAGPTDVRQQALARLEALGEVELF